MYELRVSGAVKTQGFVWSFSCAIYTFSFIYSSIRNIQKYFKGEWTDLYDIYVAGIYRRMSSCNYSGAVAFFAKAFAA